MLDVLVLGAGNCKTRRICPPERRMDFSDSHVTKIDMNPDCGADIVMELTGGKLDFFEDESFDEIHLYDSLEHWGEQGDWKGFFDEFEEYHRILKTDGIMYIIVPHTTDYFADPGHKRFFSMNHFHMLDQDYYETSLKNNRPITDYRFYWKRDFKIVFGKVTTSHIAVSIQKKGKCYDGE